MLWVILSVNINSSIPEMPNLSDANSSWGKKTITHKKQIFQEGKHNI